MSDFGVASRDFHRDTQAGTFLSFFKNLESPRAFAWMRFIMIITWLTDDAHFERLKSFHFSKVNVPDSG